MDRLHMKSRLLDMGYPEILIDEAMKRNNSLEACALWLCNQEVKPQGVPQIRIGHTTTGAVGQLHNVSGIPRAARVALSPAAGSTPRRAQCSMRRELLDMGYAPDLVEEALKRFSTIDCCLDWLLSQTAARQRIAAGQAEFRCGLCGMSVDDEKRQRALGCTHKLCNVCLQSYLHHMIDTGQMQPHVFTCPIKPCMWQPTAEETGMGITKEINPAIVQANVDSQHLYKYAQHGIEHLRRPWVVRRCRTCPNWALANRQNDGSHIICMYCAIRKDEEHAKQEALRKAMGTGSQTYSPHPSAPSQSPRLPAPACNGGSVRGSCGSSPQQAASEEIRKKLVLMGYPPELVETAVRQEVTLEGCIELLLRMPPATPAPVAAMPPPTMTMTGPAPVPLSPPRLPPKSAPVLQPTAVGLGGSPHSPAKPVTPRAAGRVVGTQSVTMPASLDSGAHESAAKCDRCGVRFLDEESNFCHKCGAPRVWQAEWCDELPKAPSPSRRAASGLGLQQFTVKEVDREAQEQQDLEYARKVEAGLVCETPNGERCQDKAADWLTPPLHAVPPDVNIGPREELATLGLEFKHNEAFQRKVRWLEKTGYVGWRRILGDGNCFYRAIGYALLEQLAEPATGSTTSALEAERQRAARATAFYDRLARIKLDHRLLTGSSAVHYPPEPAHEALLRLVAPLCELGGRWNVDGTRTSTVSVANQIFALEEAAEVVRECVASDSEWRGKLEPLYRSSLQVRAVVDRCGGWPPPWGSEAKLVDEFVREEAAASKSSNSLHLDLRLPASGRSSDRGVQGGLLNLDLALVRALRQLSVDFIRGNKDDVRVGRGLTLTELCSASSGYQGVEDFCDREVIAMGREAEGVVLSSLAMALGESFRVVYLDRAEPHGASGVEVPVMDYRPLEDSGLEAPRIHVQLRPGHYDMLYPGLAALSMPSSVADTSAAAASPNGPAAAHVRHRE